MTSTTHVSETERKAFDAKVDGTFRKWSGKAKALWGDITDDHIAEAKGNLEALVGLIQEKTGETVEDIERKLREE